MTLHISILLLVSSGIASAFSPLCETVCECQSNDNAGLVLLDCSRAALKIVPPVSDWPNNLTHLDVSDNKIEALTIELAHGNLRVLDLSHNEITSLVQSAFGGLRSLEYLNLANNNIRTFEDNGFYGLDHLKSLNISGNGLQTLPDQLFYHFIGLQELSLADNPLVHVDPVHFNRMVSLRWLDMSYIGAYALDPKTFHTTRRLQFLDLSGNDFNEVPTGALRSAVSLRHLRLSENPITVLNGQSFTKLTTLEVLELNFMEKLRKIDEEAFSDLVSLRVLDVRHNRLLSEISSRAFRGLFRNSSRPTLQEVDLQGNQLQSLQSSTVPCAKLRKFNVQQNPWNCDCRFRWIKDCEIQKIYAADLRCASPSRLADFPVISLKNDEFKCVYEDSDVVKEQIHHAKVVRGISIALSLLMLAGLSCSLALVFKWRSLKDWYKKSRKGPGSVYYVRARANPVDS